MAFGFKQNSYDAVLFLEDDAVIKEMLFSEFEAVLDGIVGEPEYAGSTCHAVFLKIDTQLNILGAVFFTIDFDRDGAADKHWNLPLSQLAETAAFGVELNGVQVRVACSSQCQIPWHQEHLWEPDLSATSNTFKQLDLSIKNNKLGLVVDRSSSKKPKFGKEADGAATRAPVSNTEAELHQPEVDADTMADAIDAERIEMARKLKKLRVQMASLKTRQQQEIDTLRADLAHEKEALMALVDEANQARDKAQHDAQQQQVQIEHLEVSMQEQKLGYEKQLSETLNKQGLDFAQLRQQFRQELQEKLIAQTGELRDKLEMREVELHYREDQIELLNNELRELKESFMDQQSPSTSGNLQDLVDNDVLFVVSLAGTGPLNIPAHEINTYCFDPQNYLAERLKISPELYAQWIEHANHPVCSACSAEEGGCNAALEIARPQEFVPGVSDRCAAHQGCAGSGQVVNA